MTELTLTAVALLALSGSARAAVPWPVKVVIVTTFEVGADKGDKPGELQLWAEREDLTELTAGDTPPPAQLRR